jgi:uncharacterized membrane protein YphA (DoxX/SURF4 family)
MLDELARRRLDAIGVLLLFAAPAVLALTLAAAIFIGTSESSLPGVDELQRENRGSIVLLVLAAGITGAGILAGLGGILRVLVAGAREET